MKNETVALEIEKSRLSREKSVMVFDKSILLYFSFLIVAVVGFINNYVDRNIFYLLVGMSLIILVIGLIPYIWVMIREEKKLNSLIALNKKARRAIKK